MNIKQIESFVCIVEQGSFAAAAETLFTTQSTISARIHELEKHFGVLLFDRSHHRARLTPKGEELLPYARQVVQLARQVTQRISDPNSLGGTVRIGVVGLVAIALLPDLVVEVRRRYPKVNLQIHAYLTRVLFDKLHNGEIDMAIVIAPVTELNVEVFPLGYDTFVWLASPSLQIPERVLDPVDLEQFPVLGFPEESHHYPVIHKWFNDNGAVYSPAISCNNMDVLANLTAAGVGITLLPQGCYQKLIEEGKLQILKTRPEIPKVKFVAIYKRGALLHPLVEVIAELAGAMGNQQSALSATMKV